MSVYQNSGMSRQYNACMATRPFAKSWELLGRDILWGLRCELIISVNHNGENGDFWVKAVKKGEERAII